MSALSRILTQVGALLDAVDVRPSWATACALISELCRVSLEVRAGEHQLSVAGPPSEFIDTASLASLIIVHFVKFRSPSFLATAPGSSFTAFLTVDHVVLLMAQTNPSITAWHIQIRCKWSR